MSDTPTPRTETDLFEATKVSLEYGNQRLFKKSQSTRIVGEVAFSDGYEYALKHSSKIKQLETELAAAQEEIDMMRIRYAAAEMHHGNNMQEVTEQRDRLAEALNKYRGQVDNEGNHSAPESLQSLNQPTP